MFGKIFGRIQVAYTDATASVRHAARAAAAEKVNHPSDTVMGEALNQWNRTVREPTRRKPNSAAVIDGYIRETGLGWSSANTKKHDAAYVKNGQFHWCGAFAAHCWAKAGLKASIRKKFMPSCYRLIKGHPFSGKRWQRQVTYNKISQTWADVLQPGDIVIVGEKGGPVWGRHITLCLEVHKDHIVTIEGNARGEGPDGSWYEGVVRQKRPFEFSGKTYGVMHAIRPQREDLDK